MIRWWGVLLCLPLLTHAEEFSFDISNYEKKPYEWGGYLELRGEHLELNPNSAFFNLTFSDSGLLDSLQRYRGEAELGGVYRFGNSSVRFRGRAQAQDDYFGYQRDARVQELYYAARSSDQLAAEIGKRVIKWGKGYAWNPVGFVERPKDPNDPELTREGYTLATADYVRSFDGPLKTIAATPLILPVTDDLNEDFSPKEDVNFAGKLYLLYRDTDIDVTFLANGSRSERIGLDFSRNLAPNFELHGEFAYLNDQHRAYIDPSNQLAVEEKDAVRALLGLRYLTKSEITWIVEYYHNGPGYSEAELERFYRAAKTEAGVSPSLFNLAREARQSGYGAPNPGKDYLYVRATKKEPFDIVYLTAGMISIINLRDDSLSVTPELVYTGIKNTETRFRFAWLQGSDNTEFGEKLSDQRVELRLRYFF